MVVLVVDDSATIRRILTMALQELGVSDIVEADSAEKALQLLTYCAVDVIISDWHMPGMSGLDLLKQLRAKERFKTTPIIMSTSESAGENVVAALQAGATSYIIKPFNKAQLAEKITPFIKRNASISGQGLPAVSGVLSDNELGQLIQYLMQTRKTGHCELECDNGPALIYFSAGQIVGAQLDQLWGEAAFLACFTVPIRSYRFHQQEVPIPDGCVIQSNSTALLLKAAAHKDHAQK